MGPITHLLAAKIKESREEQRITELKLAMAWNKFDHIRNNILTEKTIYQWTVCLKSVIYLTSTCFFSMQDLGLDEALCYALSKNKIRCADLLVGYGASFDRLQRICRLDDLYAQAVSEHLP